MFVFAPILVMDVFCYTHVSWRDRFTSWDVLSMKRCKLAVEAVYITVLVIRCIYIIICMQFICANGKFVLHQLEEIHQLYFYKIRSTVFLCTSRCSGMDVQCDVIFCEGSWFFYIRILWKWLTFCCWWNILLWFMIFISIRVVNKNRETILE